MKTQVTKLPKSRVRINIEVPTSEIRPVFEQVYNFFAQNVEVTGFRPGKAPKMMVIERVGIGKIQQEILNRVLNRSYLKLLNSHKLQAVTQPAISIEQFAIQLDGSSLSDLKATIEVDVLPEVKLTGYKSIRIKKPTPPEPVKESDVEKVIEHLRRQKANLTTINRASQLGDWADVSFKGYLNDVVNEKLTSDHFALVIGSNVMVPGFEPQLVGLAKGQKKAFNLDFPKDYFAKEFAGRKVRFEVVLNDLKQVELPKIDVEFIKTFGHNTIESLREAIKKSLGLERQRRNQNLIESQVIEAALEKFNADLPESLVDSEIDRMVDRLRGEVEGQGMPVAIYLEKIKKTKAELRVDFRSQAEHNVKVGLMLGEIVKQEGIDPKAENASRLALDRLISYATK